MGAAQDLTAYMQKRANDKDTKGLATSGAGGAIMGAALSNIPRKAAIKKTVLNDINAYITATTKPANIVNTKNVNTGVKRRKAVKDLERQKGQFDVKEHTKLKKSVDTNRYEGIFTGSKANRAAANAKNLKLLNAGKIAPSAVSPQVLDVHKGIVKRAPAKAQKYLAKGSILGALLGIGGRYFLNPRR